MDQKVLIEALGRPWFIDPMAAQHYASIVHQLVTGQATSFEEEPVKEFTYIVNAAGQKIASIADANDNGVAVINLRGAVMKYDYCGAAGTQSIMKALEQANANPSVKGIVMQIDSPGGAVDGTQQLANAVKQSGKPVVAYINGTMASAAMWIGSAAATRISSSNTDTIGSIGTMASWKDYKGYYEQQGVKSHEVYASASTHKNLAFREATEGNYDALIKTSLDPLNNEFINSIKGNLPGVDESVFNGSHYIATEAKKKGLIDKIGSFDMAVKTAMQLGKKAQATMEQNIARFQQTLTASKSEAFEVADGGFLLTEDQLQNIESTIVQTNAIALEASANFTTANEQLVAANATNRQLSERIAELESGNGAPPADASNEQDQINNGATGWDKFATSTDKEMARRKQYMN